jgi:2-polyprenyl-3-methyl-5-hydroxy-6-metoxy-1,4-benzoquinol methylase
MREDDKEKIIASYNETLRKYGYDPRSLQDFKGREHVRYKVLSEIGDLNGCSILDVGCGFGDFGGFLIKSGLNVTYTGYDINPNIIKVAKEAHPSFRFEVKDLEEEHVEEKFDWVFGSGLFNHKISNNEAWINRMLEKMVDLCKKGVGANFLSTYVDFMQDISYHASPEVMFSFCKRLSKRVTIRHDYMPYEFTVYIYKDDRINQRNVFEEFDLSLQNHIER